MLQPARGSRSSQSVVADAAPPVGVGLIGFGGFGQFLRRSWSYLPEVKVCAVSDADVRRRPDRGVRFYPEWRRLIEDPEVAIVAVATPPHTHEEVACAAIDAGKHVLVEKPLATTPEAARRIAERAAGAGVVATVDFMMRYTPVIEGLAALRESGVLGRLRRFVVENHAQDQSLPAHHWFWDAEKSGGILVEHGVHFVDIGNLLSGTPTERVQGIALRREDGRLDRMGLTVVYEDGLVASQFHAFSRPGIFERTRMRLVFDLAEVDLEGWLPIQGRIRALVSDATFRDLMAHLPNVEIHGASPIAQLVDESRPEGWGAGTVTRTNVLRSGGLSYSVDRQVDATFSLKMTKTRAYGQAVRALLADLVAAVRDPDHALRVTLQDGIRSVDIAAAATRDALRS